MLLLVHWQGQALRTQLKCRTRPSKATLYPNYPITQLYLERAFYVTRVRGDPPGAFVGAKSLALPANASKEA